MEGNPCSICWENIRTNACILNKKRMLLKDGCTILSMGLVWKRRLIDPNVLQHYLNTLHIINSIWTLYIWRHFKIIIHLERKFTRECKTCKKKFLLNEKRKYSMIDITDDTFIETPDVFCSPKRHKKSNQ
jgi:hypothetical protein